MGKTGTVGVLRLRATKAVAGDKSVGRFAQDDNLVGDWKVWELGLVGGWTKNIK